MNPKLKALMNIRDALDGIEELRNISPSGTRIFSTHCGKLVNSNIGKGDFEYILMTIDSKGIASFIHSSIATGMGWGSNPLRIEIKSWDKFDKYYQQIKNEISSLSKKGEITTKDYNNIFKTAKTLMFKNKPLTITIILGLISIGLTAYFGLINQTESQQEQDADSLPGVFIAARNIINSGEIISEGPEARTEIITENYEGSGVIKAEITQNKSDKPVRDWFSMNNPLIWLAFSLLLATFTIYLLKRKGKVS